MLFVILAICVVIFMVDIIKLDTEVFSVLSFIAGIICIIGIIVCGVKLGNGIVIDEKIEMYQQENNLIQTEISSIVENYKIFEQDTFESLKSESIITLVNLYPELKSNTLVEQQINFYIDNNSKIKELKEQKINLRMYKWWLIF